MELPNINKDKNILIADVVIVNKESYSFENSDEYTYYAVAIKYDENNPAPIVVTSGLNYEANKINSMARNNKIKIIENDPLTRSLYNDTPIGEKIPECLYAAVAEVLAHVYNGTLKNYEAPLPIN